MTKVEEKNKLLEELAELRKGLSIIRPDGTYFYDEEKENRINSLILADTPEGEAFRKEYEQGSETEKAKFEKYMFIVERLRELDREN